MNFSELTQAQLRRCGADNVGAAMEIHISGKDVTPLEVSSRKFWFRIGEMYFDLIINDNHTRSLYASNKNDDVSILISSFNAIGSLVKGVYNGKN
jgi:predicted component of type VI protein secretion system